MGKKHDEKTKGPTTQRQKTRDRNKGAEKKKPAFAPEKDFITMDLLLASHDT